LKKLKSISPISRVYETGDKPVLVQCEDLNDYVCKHNQGQSPCKKLIAEYLAYCFLDKLDVKLPPMSFIEVKEEHIDKPTGDCQPQFFKNIECFGTLHLKEAIEWSAFSFDKKDLKKIKNQEDLFIIAWCDIWLANEDRSWNNFNLLMSPEDDGWYIVPIDHGACFNSLGFDVDGHLDPINDFDSIIQTDQFKLIAKKWFKKVSEVDNFLKRLYICIESYEKSFDDILANIPPSWRIQEDYIQSLKANLFSKDWLNETKTQFLSFTKQSLILK
jgi:hypothetical protein